MVRLERHRINVIFNVVRFPENVNLKPAYTSEVALGLSTHFNQPEAINPPSFGAACATLAADPQYRRQVNNLHRQGPRPVGELLAELGFEHGIKAEIDAKLSRYARVSDLALDLTGARQFPPVPIHQVYGSQP